jgi:hypothetical protein
MILRRWCPSLALILGLGLGTSARAGGKVDWSEYLEPPGARPMPITHAEIAPSRPNHTPKQTRASRRTAAKAKAKARARAADRSKARRKKAASKRKRNRGKHR